MDVGSIDLIYADPPYCTQKDWGEFDDRWESFDVYLAYMEERLNECHRVLAETGSFYLHVDPNTSHYLKVILDGIFGRKNFRNEIAWCYQGSVGNNLKSYPRKHDVILLFSKSDCNTFHAQHIPYSESYVDSSYRHLEGDRRYRKHSDGRKYFLDEMKGVVVSSWWSDINCFATATQSKELVGYPTQKPIALLERIIRASSDAGDLVLDPFCGSGTTLAAARHLGRRYIGIDQNPNAIALCEKRLVQTQPALIPA